VIQNIISANSLFSPVLKSTLRSLGENKTNRSYRSRHHLDPLTAGHGRWALVRLSARRGDRVRIAARVAYTARSSNHSSAWRNAARAYHNHVRRNVFSDTLSLIVFAICVPIYQSGFSVSGLVVQLIEIAIFVPLILFGLSRF
jgi:hypothetical protein